jgi:hypothetical protein
MADVEKPKVQQYDDSKFEIVDEIGDQPLLYFDGMQTVSIVNGVVRIALYQLQPEIKKVGEPADLRKVVVARLVFPQAAFGGIADWLSQHNRALMELEAAQKAAAANGPAQ